MTVCDRGREKIGPKSVTHFMDSPVGLGMLSNYNFEIKMKDFELKAFNERGRPNKSRRLRHVSMIVSTFILFCDNDFLYIFRGLHAWAYAGIVLWEANLNLMSRGLTKILKAGTKPAESSNVLVG